MSLSTFLQTEQLEELYDGESFGVRLELFNRYKTEYSKCDNSELCRVLIETFETHDWVIPLESLDDIVRSAVMKLLEERGGEELSQYLDELAAQDSEDSQFEDNQKFIRAFTGWFHPGELFGPGVVS